MSQSVKLLILQFFSIGLGFFSVFYVAANIPPKLYAIVGVYEVISGISRVFTNTGLETLAIRNILLYKKNKEYSRITELVTQSLFTRIIIASFLVIPLLLYANYISTYKFNGDYFVLFVLMIFSSVFLAVNESIILLLKSFNKYFSAAFTSFSVNILGRIVAVYVFINFGFTEYIYIVITLPVMITLIVVFKLKKWISLKKHTSKKSVFLNLKKSKHFTFSSYIAYIYNMLDQLLVSIFFSAEILSSFSLAKKVLTISRTVVGNIFDPMIQKLVNVKDDLIILKNKISYIEKIKNVILIAMIIILPVLVVYLSDLLILLNLVNYPYLKIFIISIYLGIMFLIQMKVKHHIILLFYDSLYNIKLASIMSVSGALVFSLSVNVSVKAAFLYLPITYIILYIYTFFVFKKNGLAQIK